MRKPVKAPTGTTISCKGWGQEAALRMLMNNLDPEVAKDWEKLIVYGGTGQAARNWESFDAIIKALKELENDETLLIQSGKPVGIFKTHPDAPRVLIANSLIVPHWASWEYFRELQEKGLTMYGQMTAGSWIYIGTQGILQGSYETLAELAAQHFGEGEALRGRLVISGGLGEMGGALPLAIKMNEGVGIIVEIDESHINRRIRTNYLDTMMDDLDKAFEAALEAKSNKEPLSIGVLGNTAEILPEIVRRVKAGQKEILPDVVTDQTSAHDDLQYYPAGLSFEEAIRLRETDPEEFQQRARESMAKHVQAMIDFKELGSICFDYGNNLRQQAKEYWQDQNDPRGAQDIPNYYPGFILAFIRPLLCEGRGPFRYAALSGDPEDIFKLDEVIKREFADSPRLVRWITKAQEMVKFQGLPSRVVWLGYGERAHFGKVMNDMVRAGELKAPLVIGRDHLDTGSVASPNRETERMKDGSDAIADWPILNALLNAAAGATWVAVHQGGGVGIPYAIHAGMVVVADGTKEAEKRLECVLTTDPGSGIVRHADAGYEKAIAIAKEKGIKMPMLK